MRGSGGSACWLKMPSEENEGDDVSESSRPLQLTNTAPEEEKSKEGSVVFRATQSQVNIFSLENQKQAQAEGEGAKGGGWEDFWPDEEKTLTRDKGG